MPALKRTVATLEEAPQLAVEVLADATSGLVLAEDIAVARRILTSCRGQGNRAARQDTIASVATTISGPATLVAAELLEPDSRRVREANLSLLQAEISCYLRTSNSPLNSMSIADMMARTLTELDDYCSGDANPLSKLDLANSHLAEEVSFLAALWEKLRSEVVATRRDSLLAVADQAQGPAVQITWEPPPPLQDEFLERWATKHSAVLIELELDGLAKELDLLWNEPLTSQPQPAMAVTLRPESSLEDAARAAYDQLASWRAEGRQRIGIVGYDRQLVRRLNSLCSSSEVLIADHSSGWAVGNLIAGDMLLAVVNIACGGPPDPTRIELSLNRSLATNEWADEVQALRKNSALKPNGSFARTMAKLAGRLQKLTSPAGWLEEVLALTATAPLRDLFINDPAGEDIIAQIRRLLLAFENCSLDLSTFEMNLLLRNCLLRTRVRTAQIDSDLMLIEPLPSWPQSYNALLLLGSTAAKLPHLPEHLSFNDEIRARLGLPKRDDSINRMRKRTAALLAKNPVCTAIWHGGGAPSPYLQVLAHKVLDPVPPRWQTQDAGTETRSERQAELPVRPDRMPVNGCNILMKCPYQFYGNHLLWLDEFRKDDLFDNSEYGSLVHKIIEELHRDPDVAALSARLSSEATQKEHSADLADLTGLLHASTKRVLAESKLTATALARQLFTWRWLPLLPLYANLFLQRRRAGWTVVGIEKKIEAKLSKDLLLTGKIDCLEERDGTRAVIDFKTGQTRPKEAVSGEQPQLPLYAAMADASSAASCFIKLRIENGAPVCKELPLAKHGGHDRLGKQLQAHFSALLSSGLAAGQTLPANGAESSCRYCRVQGLCRRGHWQEQAS